MPLLNTVKTVFFEVTENGRISSDAQCAYGGHGTLIQDLLVSYYRAVIKKLFNKAGSNVQNWLAVVGGDSLASTYRIQCRFNYENSTTIDSFFADTFTSSTTYDTFARELVIQHLTTFVGDAKVQVIEYQLRRRDETEATYLDIASINCDRLGVDLKTTIKMTLQNQTPNDSGGDNGNLTDVVNPNPLVGKVYQRYGSCFQVNNRYVTADTPYVDPSSGLIIYTTPALSIYKKPPGKGFFKNVKNMIPFTLHPGATRDFTYSRTQHFSVDRFFKLLGTNFHTSIVTTENLYLGCAQLFALEKKLDSREVGQSNISVAAQYNWAQGIKLTMSKMTPANVIVSV